MQFTVTTNVTIPGQTIADLMCDALEQGSTYWLEGFDTWDVGDLSYRDAEFWENYDGSVVVYSEDFPKGVEINGTTLARSLSRFARYYDASFKRIMNDTWDSDDSDLLLQYACFEDIIYG